MKNNHLNDMELHITRMALGHSIEFYKSELLKLNNHYQSCTCDTLARSINEHIKFIESELTNINNLLGKLGGTKIDRSELLEGEVSNASN